MLLGPLLGKLPADLLQTEVLRRLGPTDLVSLALAGRGFAAAVASTALMKWARRYNFAYPRRTNSGLLLRARMCLEAACVMAACGGHLEVLMWLHSTGCTWDASTCAAAAGIGRLDVLRWARDHGCPWNLSMCTCAAQAGQLEVLQWVRENDADGEAWDEKYVRRYAAGPRKQEVLTWLVELSGP